ncbi:helix-turn-helix transcriptional regulator [Streptacidiphilus griseoplanus]|uniref:helix-turn-helix transcriptional regulator n=1 Tax=Peterkaempfera griseoplana TaxID=66896 RepID=UPI0006E342CA|nr:helix-turn-helix transcriptional regulator [Peterkaempfera griseoplana]
MARQELARYLRERRTALRPDELGLPVGTPRRTPGLRREEVAELAHMSVDYYVRLEQARGPRPSPRILDALAQALRLAPAERSHLFRLAGTSAPPPTAGAVGRVSPHVSRMLQRLPETGAIVTDAAYGVIACNPLARALLGDDLGLRRANLARRRFLGDGGMYESSSAEEFGHIVVARLRRAADRYPHDPQLAALLGELRTGSEEFRRLWETRPVHAPGHRIKTLDHPTAGRLRLNCDVLLVPEDDQEVVLITADPGSPEARTLRRLASTAPYSGLAP